MRDETRSAAGQCVQARTAITFELIVERVQLSVVQIRNALDHVQQGDPRASGRRQRQGEIEGPARFVGQVLPASKVPASPPAASA